MYLRALEPSRQHFRPISQHDERPFPIRTASTFVLGRERGIEQCKRIWGNSFALGPAHAHHSRLEHCGRVRSGIHVAIAHARSSGPQEASEISDLVRMRPRLSAHSVAEGSEMSLELIDFLAGCVGGCAGIVVGHPFDTIKADSQGKLAGPLVAIKDLLRREGVLGLYKGIESPLIANVPIQALVFGSYGASLRRIGTWAGVEDGEEAPISHHVLAGTLQVPIVCVADYCKIQMQNQFETKKKLRPGSVAADAVQRGLYRNSIECMLKVSRAHGAATVFRGMSISWLRDVTYGQYFGMYEWLKRIFVRHSGGNPSDTNAIASAVAGGLSGTFGWAMAYPLDAVKTRVQAHPAHLPAVSARECARTMAAELPHYKAFSRGLGLTLLRALPVNMVTFVVYEWVLALRSRA